MPPKIFLSIQSPDIYFAHKNHRICNRICKNMYLCVIYVNYCASKGAK